MRHIVFKGEPSLLMQHLRSKDDGFIIFIKAKPQSKYDEISVSVDEVCVRVSAPARNEQANVRLQKMLATIFGIAQSKVVILKGQQARQKAFYIIERDRAALLANVCRSIG